MYSWFRQRRQITVAQRNCTAMATRLRLQEASGQESRRKNRRGKRKMTSGIYDEASKKMEEQNDDTQFADRRLWTAVLLQALEDWKSNNRRRQSEAERFLFHSEKDFQTVCKAAGLEPSYVFGKVQKMKKTMEPAKPRFVFLPQAA
jgi:hypothetical protein